MFENWENFGSTVNSAFFFVLNKIISLQSFFIDQAYAIGQIVLLIALCSAGLNYALTGTNLKENLIKIMKATLFFLIVIAAYPRIIGWITSYTFDLAYKSLGKSVENYFDEKVTEEVVHSIVVSDSNDGKTTYHSLFARFYNENHELKLFESMTYKDSVQVKDSKLDYTSIAPAAAIQVVLLVAYDAFQFADSAKDNLLGIPSFSQILKGLICGFFLIITGIFALLEYLICFLEFMLVASVGVILFPLSIWEGSKFLSEKYIGAIVGFFIKLLLCNIAIFLLLYGFISMFHILEMQRFSGSPDQFSFIGFVCLLFFYICKSAPGIAQSLLTGSPNLSASGAIGAVAGAVGAAAGVARFSKKAGGLAGKVGGAIVGGGVRAVGNTVGSLVEANAARKSAMQNVKDAGGTDSQQKQAGRRAFASSLVSDAGDSIKSGALGLARSISGNKNGGSSGSSGGITNPHSWRQDFLNTPGGDGKTHQTIKEHLDKRREEGSTRGEKSAEKFIKKNKLTPPNKNAGQGI